MNSDDAIEFVLTPAESDVDISAQYQPFIEYLEAETGATITPRATSSHTETLQAIRNDQAEIADTSPFAAVAGASIADVIGIRVAFGAEQYFSLLTTTPDSDVDSLEDLADIDDGDVALGDPLSVSGTLFPLLMLSEAGVDIGNAPEGDAVDVDLTHSDHTTAKEQLINRDDVLVAGTGAFSTAPHVPKAQFDELSSEFGEISVEYADAGTDEPELQLLGVSDPIPRAPLMVRSNWDDPVRDDLEAAMLSVDESDLEPPADADEDEELWFSGVTDGSIDDYDPIDDLLDELGLELQDLDN